MADFFLEEGSSRRPIELGDAIAQGAAGNIHLIVGRVGEVAKIYRNPRELPEYSRKIGAMIAAPPRLPSFDRNGKNYAQIAWPTSRIVNSRGDFLGFVMPEIDFGRSLELENVLQKATRQRKGITEFYGARVLLAANLSALVAELHSVGHYMIDMKPVNVRFYPDVWYLAILDTDGFSINYRPRLPAKQFSDDYIAPEAKGKRPEDLGLDQDLFALAVIAFRLLNGGIHPFQGVDSANNPTTLQERIFAGLYAYGLRPHQHVAPAPSSIHGYFEDETRKLFDRAFAPRGPRPTAAEWRDHLKRLIDDQVLVKCATDPRNHAHFSKGCGLCFQEHRILAGHQNKRSAAMAPMKKHSQQVHASNIGGVNLPPPPAVKAPSKRHSSVSPAPASGGASLPTPRRAQGNLLKSRLDTVVGALMIGGVVFAIYWAVSWTSDSGSGQQEEQSAPATTESAELAKPSITPAEDLPAKPGEPQPEAAALPPEPGQMETADVSASTMPGMVSNGVGCLSREDVWNGYTAKMADGRTIFHKGVAEPVSVIESVAGDEIEKVYSYRGLFSLAYEKRKNGQEVANSSIAYNLAFSEMFPLSPRVKGKVRMVVTYDGGGKTTFNGTIRIGQPTTVGIGGCHYSARNIDVALESVGNSGERVTSHDELSYSEELNLVLASRSTVQVGSRQPEVTTAVVSEVAAPAKQSQSQPQPLAPAGDFASVLKNVAKIKETPPVAPVLLQPEAQPPPAVGSTDQLSASDIDIIRQQVAGCWIVDVGMRGIEEMAVEVHVQLNPDGSVFTADFDRTMAAADPNWWIFADSALRAVKKCSPLPMPATRPYSAWQYLTLVFNAREMLGL
jgi:hypothetical protein